MSDRTTLGRPNRPQDSATIAPVRAIRRTLRTLKCSLISGLLLLGNPYGQLATSHAQQPGTAPAMEIVIKARPDFQTVEQSVAAFFRSQKDFQSNDLLKQSQIDKALDAVLIAGWDVPDRKAIVSLAIADGSFLDKELSTPNGRKFMRHVAGQPGGFSRLDRLSAIAGGQQIIRDLIRQRDGHQFIAYLATTSGGHNLGRMAANTRNGVDLNKPTGKIYTLADLTRALKVSYDRTNSATSKFGLVGLLLRPIFYRVLPRARNPSALATAPAGTAES